VQNVQNETSLYYLLSNNYINEIISSDFGVRMGPRMRETSE
jgi:hypothetical protein